VKIRSIKTMLDLVGRVKRRSKHYSSPEDQAADFNGCRQNEVDSFDPVTSNDVSASAPMFPINADPAISGTTSFVGRQPIFDVQLQVFGYELLFRSGWENHFAGDSDTATRQMIDNILLRGVDTFVLGGKAFVNCTREALTRPLVTFLPAASTVLEILETVTIDDEIISACVRLKSMGYQIALDDFLPDEGHNRLIEIADYIKLDFRTHDANQLRQIQLQLQGTNVALIAEKIETHEEFEYAIANGYRYFQGYFFARPSILLHREIPPNRLNYLLLFTALSCSPFDLDKVENLVMAETSLCYRLLRLVNSAGFGISRKISSVHEALVLMGEDRFRQLATVAMATGLGKESGKSHELILLSLQRARFCELLAPFAQQPAAEQYLIGLLSVVDAILEIPMEQVVKMLPLRPAVVAAFLGETNPVAAPLRLLQYYEQAQWESCSSLCRTLGVSETEITNLYLASLQWAVKESRNSDS
jgi:EAL and modified HD-GYP domain-containing signal transduction protein